MSMEEGSRISRPPTAPTPASPGDHRKRRRNRTTQSCLNCHASKRMCDRKRPACQRCTTLGLTGLCVYEVDDPSQRNSVADEKVLLRSRVAELEGVIREMKNKPHPRWAQKPANSHIQSPPPSDDDSVLPVVPSTPCPDIDYGNTSAPDEALTLPSVTSQLNAPSICLAPVSPSSGPSFACDTPLTPQDPHFLRAYNLPSPPNSSMNSSPAPGARNLPRLIVTDAHPTSTPEFNVDSLLASASLEPTGFEEGIYGYILDHIMQTDQAKGAAVCGCDPSFSQSRGSCGCIENTMVYNSLLELSIRLRKTVESLGKVADHNTQGYGFGCQLYERIRDLDKLTSSILGNATSPIERQAANETFFPPLSAEFMPTTISPNRLTTTQHWEANIIAPVISSSSDDDSLMSWDGVSREAWAHIPRS